MTNIITLTTDFGTSDTYVAQMKGVILGINPTAQIVDVSHAIAPQNVRQAACVLDQFIEAFPENSVHVLVIDPGVGSERRIIGAEIAGRKILAPDNGLISVLAKKFPPTRIHTISETRFFRSEVSSVFHGRDKFAPVAAHWSLGTDLSKFGPQQEDFVKLPVIEPRQTSDAGAPPEPPLLKGGKSWQGVVDYIDHFGNLATNITARQLPGDETRRDLQIHINGTTINGLNRYYAERPAGEPLALIGSSGHLEIAINQGNAATELNAQIGTAVVVVMSSQIQNLKSKI